MKETQLTRLQKCGKCVYNSENGTIFGRTPKSWGLIFIFYVFAYAFLCAFFTGMISVFMYVYVKEDRPSLTGMHSVLSLNPGLGFIPRVSTGYAFLHLAAFDSEINADYVLETSKMFSRYKTTGDDAIDCVGVELPKGFPDKPCRFPVTTLDKCDLEQYEVSLTEGKPCVYLHMNKIFGWLPEMNNVTEIRVRCYGQNDVAQGQLGIPEYFPQGGTADAPFGMIPTTYFPFIRQSGYQTPLVAVRFPRMKKNTVVLIECKVEGLKNSDATIGFELAVDTLPASASTPSTTQTTTQSTTQSTTSPSIA